MKEIILIGFYQQNEPLRRFIASMQHDFKIPVRCAYLPNKIIYVILFNLITGLQVYAHGNLLSLPGQPLPDMILLLL